MNFERKLKKSMNLEEVGKKLLPSFYFFLIASTIFFGFSLYPSPFFLSQTQFGLSGGVIRAESYSEFFENELAEARFIQKEKFIQIAHRAEHENLDKEKGEEKTNGQEISGEDEEESESGEKAKLGEVEDGGRKSHQAKGVSDIIFDTSRIFSHMHNKIVHFPIALGIMTGIFDILSFFAPAVSLSAKILLGFTALSSIAAFLSGQVAEEEVEDSLTHSLAEVLEIHESLGLTAMVIYIVAFVLRLIPGTQKLSKIIVILAVPLISFVGYLGGILSH